MPTLTPPQRQVLERIYHDFLYQRAKTQRKESPYLGRFDPQGRWITEVTLTADDYKRIVDSFEQQGYLIQDPTPTELSQYSSWLPEGLSLYKTIVNFFEREQKPSIQDPTPTEPSLCGKWLRDALSLARDDFSDTTLCSIDCAQDEAAKNVFNAWLPDVGGKRLHDFWESDGRGSITPLQEELESHQSLLLRGFEKFLLETPELTRIPTLEVTDLELTHDDINEAFVSVRKALQSQLNQAMSQVMRDALEKVIGDQSALDVRAMNDALNDARKSLTQSLHDDVIDHLMLALKKQQPLFSVRAFQAQWVSACSKLDETRFESTAATGYAYLRTSDRQQTCTWMSPARYTAHNKAQGFAHHASRLITRHFFDPSNGLVPVDETVDETGNSIIRAPSLAPVTVGLSDAEIILDVQGKLGNIRDRFMAHRPDKPLVYNLLTSLNRVDGKPWKLSHQIKSARLILQAAHQFNRVKKTKQSNGFVFVQNIGVNQHTPALCYDTQTPALDWQSLDWQLKQFVIPEALLMSEVSLLHTLSSSFSDNKDLNEAYKKDLNDAYTDVTGYYSGYLEMPESPPRFFESVFGNAAITRLAEYQKNCVIPPLPEGDRLSKALIATALLRLFKESKHREPLYGMLTQALSVYLEKDKLVGCKSGNERFTAVEGRASMLLSMVNRNLVKTPYSEQEQLLLETFRKYATSGDNAVLNDNDEPLLDAEQKPITLLKQLKDHMDKAINAGGYQSDAMAVSHEDQGAGPKGKSSKGPGATISEIDTNVYESSNITTLRNSHASSLQAHKVEHATKLKASVEALRAENYEHYTPPVKDEHAVNNLEMNQAKNNLEDRVATVNNLFDENSDPDFLNALYDDMLKQEVKYDDDKGVQSFFGKNNDGSVIYVRDARGLGAASDMTKKETTDLKNKYCKRQANKTSRQWLVMGLNYTLAFATLLQVHGKLDSAATDRLTAMKKMFIAIAEREDSPLDECPDRWKAHFLNYVQNVLAVELNHYFPDLCQKRSEYDTNTAIKLLDKSKDWVAMQRPSFHVATVSQLQGQGVVGVRPSKGAFIQYEEPICSQTQNQKVKWETYQESTWYKKLGSVDRNLCNFYQEKICSAEGRVIPAQLRTRMGIGGRNTYNSETYYQKDGELKKILQHGHSGGLPILLDTNQYEKTPSWWIGKQWLGLKKWLNKDWVLNDKDSYEAAKLQMAETAADNLDQRIEFAKRTTGNDNVKVLSIILNSNKAAKWAKGDKTDFNITRFTDKATHGNKGAFYFRPGVALGQFEPSDPTFLQDTVKESKKFVQSIKDKKLGPDYYGDLDAAIKDLEQSMPKVSKYWPGNSWFTFGNHTGITLAAKLMLLLNVRNAVRSRLVSDSRYEALTQGVHEIYTNISCASGDNRTQDGSLYSQICALNLHSEFPIKRKGWLSNLKDRITNMLALNGHAHIMAGSQGGSFGTVGIRGQSMDAFPSNSGFRKLHKEILSTQEADLKSAQVTPVKKQTGKKVVAAALFTVGLLAIVAFAVVTGGVSLAGIPLLSVVASWLATPVGAIATPVFGFLFSVTGVHRWRKASTQPPEVDLSAITNEINGTVDGMPLPGDTFSPLHSDQPSITVGSQKSAGGASLRRLASNDQSSVPPCIKTWLDKNPDYTVSVKTINPSQNPPECMTGSQPMKLTRSPKQQTNASTKHYVIQSKTNPQGGCVDVVTAMGSTQTEVVEHISTKSPSGVDTVMQLAVSSIQGIGDSGDYFEITGRNFEIKYLLALSMISRGIDVTQPDATVRWSSLRADYQGLTADQKKAVDSRTITEMSKHVGNTEQVTAVTNLQKVCSDPERYDDSLNHKSSWPSPFSLFGGRGKPSDPAALLDCSRSYS